jgi:hypothetical protein
VGTRRGPLFVRPQPLGVQSVDAHNAPGSPGADPCPVTAKQHQIVIEVNVDGDEIRGDARDADGEARPFLGWLGLITALDALLDEAVPPRAGG